METEVLIVGAGPVGLLLANLLGQKGIRCALIERRSALPVESRAIGITPPSLRVLHRLGLDEPLIRLGVRVTEAVVHGNHGELGRVRFDRLPGPYPFMLAVPQTLTMRLLAENLTRLPSVDCRPGNTLHQFTQQADHITAELDTGTRARASYLVGCDGSRSTVRTLSGITCRQKYYEPRFIMGDFADETGWGETARLFFTTRGSVESFPLPGGQRRWIVLGGPDLIQRVQEITGIALRGVTQLNQSWFQPERLLCNKFVNGRVILCGDAAHVMSPIGGQGMNTGFADAELLAEVLAQQGNGLRQYEKWRRRAFRRAANRAARGMWLGTRTGRVASALQNWFIGRVLLRPPIVERLPAYFAMLTLPGGIPLRTEPPDALFPNLTKRANLREWMERPDCNLTRLRRTYKAFRPINRLYARYPRVLGRWLIADMQRAPDRHYHIADLGSGAGDIAAWLAQRCRALGLRVTVHGIDSDPYAIAFAQEHYGTVPGLKFHQQNALDTGQLAGMDYVYANHLLHHFRDEEIVAFLRGLAALRLRGFVLSDLQRSYYAYYGHSVVGLLFPGTYVGVDGRLSLRRAFTLPELQELLTQAGLNAAVHCLFPARVVIVNQQ